MEESLKNILFLISSKIDHFIEELKEKKNILTDIINTKIIDFQNKKEIKNIDDMNQRKEIFKIYEIEKKVKNILIKEYKNDFIMYSKQMIELFEIIENNEPLNNKEKPSYIVKNNNNFPGLRLDQKYTINNLRAIILCLCSIKEKNNIYNKLCVGLNNGNIYIYNLENGDKLLKIKSFKNNNNITDIIDLKEGIIACTNKNCDIIIYKIKEDILLNKNNIFKVKCSYELIQILEYTKKIEMLRDIQIINLKPKNKYLFIESNYLNDYIIQTGQDKVNIYVKNNNNKYCFYKEIEAPSKTCGLIGFDEYNYFFAYDYYNTAIYIFSSLTMELVTIINEIEGTGNRRHPFGKLNNNIFVVVGTFKIFFYNIIGLELIQEIELEDYYGNYIILSEKNNLLVSLESIDHKENIIMEYEFFPIEKKIKQKNKYSSEILNMDTIYSKNEFFYSNNDNGKRNLIILRGSNEISILK